jgi:hypothetical protein
MTRFTEEEIERLVLERSDEAKKLLRENKDKFKSAVMSADGRLGLALELTDAHLAAENDERRSETLALIEAAAKRGGFSELYSAVTSLPQKRADLTFALDRAISAVRDIIVLREDRDAVPVFFTDRERAKSLGEGIGEKRLFALYDALSEAQEYCQKNANVSNLLNLSLFGSLPLLNITLSLVFLSCSPIEYFIISIHVNALCHIGCVCIPICIKTFGAIVLLPTL